MNMVRLLIVYGATALIFWGCGSWDQNPLGDKGSNFQKGIPRATKAIPGDPVQSDFLRIVAPKNITFAENVEHEIDIASKVLEEGYTTELSITNLEEMPDATFDSGTGKFKWRPRVGFVNDRSPGSYRTHFDLKVKSLAFKPNTVVLAQYHDVRVEVLRDFFEPLITAVEVYPGIQNFVEGRTYTIKVTYIDKDGIANRNGSWARAVMRGIADQPTLASFLFPTGARSIDVADSKFEISLRLELKDAEITSSITSTMTEFIVVSQFGKASPPFQLAMPVVTKMTEPVTDWQGPITAEVGETLTYTFLILDPKQEAVVAAEPFNGLPSGAAVRCSALNLSTQSCTLTYRPVVGSEGNQIIPIVARYNNKMTPDQKLSFHTRGTVVVIPRGIAK